MVFRGREASLVFSTVYSVLAMTTLLYIHRSFIPLVPIAIAMLFLVFKRVRPLLRYAVYSSMFFIALFSDIGLYMSLPLALATPFFIFVEDVREFNISSGFLGPSAHHVFRMLVASSLLMLVDPRVLVPISITSATAILRSVYTYAKLSKVRIDVFLSRDLVAIGENTVVVVKVYSPRDALLIIDTGVSKVLQRISGDMFIEFSLPANHVGRNSVSMDIFAADVYGYSYRRIARYTLEYTVVPLTQRILEVIAKHYREASIDESLRSAIEVAVLELSQGIVAAPITGEKALEVLRGYLARAERGRYPAEVLRRFVEVFEEVIGRATGYSYGFTRRTYLGEYIGSRHYTPGDLLKHIHWKKSVSRRELIVKEFSGVSADIAQVAAERRSTPIVLLDLYAPNTLELNSIVYQFLRLCLDVVRSSPYSEILTIIVMGNTAIGIRGRAIAVLYQLYRVFKGLPLRMVYSYEPRGVNRDCVEEVLRAEKPPKPLSIAVLSNEVYAEALLKLILENMFAPPRPVKVIHSRVLVFRYTVVINKLKSAGYRDLEVYTAGRAEDEKHQ